MITIRSIRSAIVRRSDEFNFTEEPPTVRHRPRMSASSGASDIVGAYVVADLSDESSRAWSFDVRTLNVAALPTVVLTYPEETYKRLALNFALITLAKEGISRS